MEDEFQIRKVINSSCKYSGIWSDKRKAEKMNNFFETL